MSTPTYKFKRGDKVVFNNRDGAPIKGLFSHIAPNGKAYIKGEDGKSYERDATKLRLVGQANTTFDAKSSNGEFLSNDTGVPKKEWDVNRRFDFLGQLVRMVVSGTSVSLVVTGEGGLGKSYTVKKEILKKNLSPMTDYVTIKGFSTPRGLYRILFENNGKLIVFDDTDSILDDKIAVNLLKSALDSYDEREIHWITKTQDESLPDSFMFTGRIIFISNKDQSNVDQALLSRSMNIDLTMSEEDKCNRMQWIVDNSKSFMPSYKKEWKQESLNFIKEKLPIIKELSLRSLEKVLKIRAGEEVNVEGDDENPNPEPIGWKELAEYMLAN